MCAEGVQSALCLLEASELLGPHGDENFIIILIIIQTKAGPPTEQYHKNS